MSLSMAQSLGWVEGIVRSRVDGGNICSCNVGGDNGESCLNTVD
jgi:hypothetical protein